MTTINVDCLGHYLWEHVSFKVRHQDALSLDGGFKGYLKIDFDSNSPVQIYLDLIDTEDHPELSQMALFCEFEGYRTAYLFSPEDLQNLAIETELKNYLTYLMGVWADMGDLYVQTYEGKSQVRGFGIPPEMPAFVRQMGEQLGSKSVERKTTYVHYLVFDSFKLEFMTLNFPNIPYPKPIYDAILPKSSADFRESARIRRLIAEKLELYERTTGNLP